MNKIIGFLLLSTILCSCISNKNGQLSTLSYPDLNDRILSEENVTYFIDPNLGNDANEGTERGAPWRTFEKVNQLKLTKGNTIEILSAGTFRESLFIVGNGTKGAPITVQFAPGKYDFFPEKAFKSRFHISNTNDAADSLKAVAFYFLDSKNITIKGAGSEILFRGKTIATVINKCENITIEGLHFDYKRPTVSEMKVINVSDHFVDVYIHNDSNYKIKDSTLIWVGEGWEHKAQNLWQVFDMKLQRVRRISFNIDALRFSELEKNKLRIQFDKKQGFVKGLIYQNRNTFRDYAAFFAQESNHVLWKNVEVNFMHGMGFVNQFSENITFDALQVKPKANSGRTCAAWADILHFSGCKGEIVIKNSYLSAANDDAINVHGTHLRIVETPSKQKIKVRFIHPQSYGFDAFYVGDSIEFISAKSLLPYADNVISKVVRLGDYEFVLTLEENIPDNIQDNDVIENTTWTPNVRIQHSTFNHIPTRGILISTRGKVLIENNRFLKTYMSSILIADDANGWFESGYVKHVTIRKNEFIHSGSPVINIHPENTEIVNKKAVHKNVLISNNIFRINNNVILSARSTDNIELTNNFIETSKNTEIDKLVSLVSCTNVSIDDNKIETN